MPVDRHTVAATSYDLAPDRNDASLGLHVLRFLAAQAVVFGHAISFFHQYPALDAPRSPYMQNIGVIIFFLLSGFLIAHSLRNNFTRPDYGFGRFVIDRASRIYAGFIPALLFVVVLDLAVIRSGVEYPYQSAFSMNHFIGNILMLQGYNAWGVNELLTLVGLKVTSFGSARPFWTLAIEMWIYLFVGSVVFLVVRKRDLRALPLVVFLSLFPLVNLFGGSGNGLFLVWLLGAGVEWVIHQDLLGRVRSLYVAALMLCSMGVYGAYHWLFNANVYFPPSYPIFATIILCAITLSLRTKYTVNAPKAYSVVSFAAGYTYTLFLVHYSILSAVVAITPTEHHLTAMWLAIAGSQLIAITLAQFGEKRTASMKTALLALAQGGVGQFILNKKQ